MNHTKDHDRQHPFFSGTFDEGEDPFTPILISHGSGSTVCSGITMDEALLDCNLPLSNRPQHEPDHEPLQHEPPGVKRSLLELLAEFNEQDDEPLMHSTGKRSFDLDVQSDDLPVLSVSSIRHTNLANNGNAFMTRPHNIQSDSGIRCSIGQNFTACEYGYDEDEEKEDEDNDNRGEQTYDKDDIALGMEDLGWGGIKEASTLAKASDTESTVESEEDEGSGGSQGDSVHQSVTEILGNATPSSVATMNSLQQHVSIQVDNFDTELVTDLEHYTYDFDFEYEYECDDATDDDGDGDGDQGEEINLFDTNQIQGEQGFSFDTFPSPATFQSSQRVVSIQVEDFDMDHLTILEDSIYDNIYGDDDDSYNDGETSVVRKVETNASELYWVQLTAALKDSARLTNALKGNTAVRNVTVYPSSIEELSHLERKSLVDAICQLKNLRNLIVFHDCGSLFVDPLIRYRPPLTRLTLYRLDVSGDSLLSKLVMLLVGLHGLEDLALEKYKGDNDSRFIKSLAKVLPCMKSLKSLSMTPARSVKLTRDGPHDLFRALWKNKTIRTLSLQGSADAIDQSAITELENALKANTVLEEVKLTGFWKSEGAFWKRFTEKSKSRIDYFLGLNKAGIRNLQLDINTDFETLKSAVVSHKDNLDHVYYLLLNNPSLVFKSV